MICRMTLHLCAVCMALLSTAAAMPAQAGEKVRVLGDFINDDKQNAELSGIACSTPLGEPTRTCLVALDEGLSAQWVILTLGPTPTLEVVEAAPLFDETAKTSDLLAAIPQVSCSGGTGNFNEQDSEGVAFGGGHFFIAGSHGCGRKTSKFKASSFVDVRLGPRGAAEAPALSPLLNATLQSTGLKSSYGKDIADGGITVEGIAASDDTLFFGLRSPVGEDGAHVVAVDADALFAGGSAPAGVVYKAKLGGSGIRDLAVLDNNPLRLLVLAGPDEGEGGPFEVFLFEPNRGEGSETTARLIKLDVPGSEKAEGLLIAAREGNDVTVLVLHDGVSGGDPTLHKLTLP